MVPPLHRMPSWRQWWLQPHWWHDTVVKIPRLRCHSTAEGMETHKATPSDATDMAPRLVALAAIALKRKGPSQTHQLRMRSQSSVLSTLCSCNLHTKFQTTLPWLFMSTSKFVQNLQSPSMKQTVWEKNSSPPQPPSLQWKPPWGHFQHSVQCDHVTLWDTEEPQTNHHDWHLTGTALETSHQEISSCKLQTGPLDFWHQKFQPPAKKWRKKTIFRGWHLSQSS